MLAETLTTQFTMNDMILRANTAGITHEESLLRAVHGSSNMKWVVGHVVATRCDALPALRQESVWTDAQTGLYRRGMALAEKPQFLPFEDVLAAFAESQARILAGIATATAADFAGPAPFNPGPVAETLGSLLMKMAVHEAYHLGQTGILRRVAGKPGVLH